MCILNHISDHEKLSGDASVDHIIIYFCFCFFRKLFSFQVLYNVRFYQILMLFKFLKIFVHFFVISQILGTLTYVSNSCDCSEKRKTR